MNPIDFEQTERASVLVHSGRFRTVQAVFLVLSFWALGQATAASEPEIVRVQVPAGNASRLFPPGTELRILKAEAFESLVKRSSEAIDRRLSAEPARLVRARHRARWDGSVLTGETDLVIARSLAGPADYVLDVWSPAVLSATTRAAAGFPDGGLPVQLFAEPARLTSFNRSSTADSVVDKLFGARDTGMQSILIDRYPRQAVRLVWELQAQKRVGGRSMHLALPAEATTTLALEMPPDWIPSVRVGRRRGPLSGGRADFILWEIEAEAGRIELELFNPDRGDSPAVSNLWVSGTTQIDVRGTVDRAGGPVNWSTEWVLELDPRNPKALEVELDPGLELLDVVGSAVRGFRIERASGAGRVIVTLGGELKSMTEVRFLAHARVPLEGVWPIPAIKPLNATWTGGTTTVFLDRSHVVAECTEGAGRRLAGPREETDGTKRLVFQASSPRSVAELVFRRPGSESSCLIRGHLFVSGSPARLECQLDWTAEESLPSELEIELSPGWIAERVLIRGVADPLPWHASRQPSGSTRLQVAIPGSALLRKEISLAVSGSASSAGSRGPLELPRLHPAGARIVDDAWLAWADRATKIRPEEAAGLAWIDPGQVWGLVPAREASGSLREALAWRWIDQAGRARVEREPIEQEPGASIVMVATVDPAKQRVALDGRLSVVAGAEALTSIPIWALTPAGSPDSLIFDDPGGVRVARPLLDQSARAALGLPEGGLALGLLVKIASQGERTIHFHADYPWAAGSPVPMLAVSRKYLQRGVIVVKTPPAVRPQFKAAGLRVLDARAHALEKLDPVSEAEAPGGDRRESDVNNHVHAFEFSEPGARLELQAEPLEPMQEAGVVREALLVTSIDSSGIALHRLRLLLHCGKAHSLDLVLPAGVSLARVRRDGVDVAPIGSGTGVSIPLPGASQGAKLCSVSLDYIAGDQAHSKSGRMRAVLPAVSLPCLSFTWELVAPRGYEAVDWGPGLVAARVERSVGWPDGGLELWRRGWELLRGPTDGMSDELMRSLDQRLDESAGGELTFAEWFSRWDSGPRAVIIDRISLCALGLGPKSVCNPGRRPGKRVGISLETLEQHGLALVVFPSALLITSAAELPYFDDRIRSSGAVAQALLWGADRGDRLETLPQWRGESSPKAAALSGEEGVERLKLLEGWSTSRFTAPCWPGSDAYLYLIDVRAQVVSAWLIAAILLVAWVLCRRRIERLSWRYPGLVALMSSALLIEWFVPSRYASYAAGAFCGGLLVLVVGLARGIGRIGESPRRRTESSLVRRAEGAVLATGLLALLFARAASGQRAIEPGAAAPLLVLFPYDGEYDPNRAPESAILRLADFDRLTRLAEAEEVAPRSCLRAVRAVHHIRRKTGREVVVETELVLVASGQSPWVWRLPVSGAREIETTLDGRRIPLSIAPGGQLGAVAIPRAGDHVLVVRRSFATKSEAGFEVLGFAVNPIAVARVVVDRPAPGEGAPVLAATGGTQLQGDGATAGRLGPAERVELRWAESGAQLEQKQGSFSMEGLILWDIEPAGDRVRTRLLYQSSRELRSMRLSHSSGLILRSARVPGSGGYVWCENSGKHEWALHFDPPLEAGGTIEIDSWMPSENLGIRAGRSVAAGGEAGAAVRELPAVQPIGAERFSGSLGARRPGDWTGRLDALPGSEPISDESFVNAWGSLPEDPLTLCGTRRFVRECRASLSTGAMPTRLSVRPTVQLEFVPGRVVMTVEAELAEPSGRFGRVEAKVPSGLRMIQVSAPGLEYWSTTADGRLRLLFDGSTASSRKRLRLVGSIPVSEEPLKSGSRPHRIAIPWIDWQDMEVIAGFLVASSISKLETHAASGVTLISSESSGAQGTTAPRNRLTFRVDDPRGLGEISWTSIPASVSVLVDSQMTIHPDSASWVAVLRYDVVGGALDAIHLRMPASWSAAADLHFSGSGHQLTTETRGQNAVWTITPERPVWGSQRLVVRSSRPLLGDREITHPEISPLGRGAVDACLAVVNGTGRPATIENPVGLDRIEYSSRFLAREFAAATGTPLGAFRVVKELPVLKVQLPRDLAIAGESPDGSARLGFADVKVVVMPDGSSLGQGTYEPVSGGASFLAFELAEESTLLWATVDSNPVTPLRSNLGKWSIALDDGRQSHVNLIWRTGASGSLSSRTTWPVGIPRVGQGTPTSLVTVYVPAEHSLGGEFGGLRSTSMARLEMVRADWLLQSVNDFVPRIDRGSNRDHQKLVAMLIGHEMRLRSAARSEQRTLLAGDAEAPGAGGSPSWIQAARAGREDAARRAALEQDLAIANRYLGEVASSETQPSAGVPEPNAPERIRTLGRPIPLLGVLPGVDVAPARISVVRAGPSWAGTTNERASRTIVALLVLMVIGLLTTGRQKGVRTRGLALFMALGLAAITGGPFTLLGALGLAVAGFRKARVGGFV
jgi:hypothetical protein